LDWAGSLRAMSAAVPHPRLAARRARVRTIRRTIVALTVALFLATWALIFGTLVTGHDPALAAKHGAGTQAGSSGAGSASSPSTSSSGGTAASPSTPSDGAFGDDASGSSPSGSSSSGSTSAPSLSTHQS
jgi:hypothetical protein